jgi:hypothetical protein
MEERKSVLEAEIKAKFTIPYNEYMGQYRETRDRIKECHRREEAMKKHTENSTKYRNKQDLRANAEQQRMDAAIPAFEELVEELKKDLAALMSDTDSFFIPLMATLFQIQANWFRNIQSKQEKLLVGINCTVPPINPVITPRERSSMTKQYMSLTHNAFDTPSSSSSQPSVGGGGGGARPASGNPYASGGAGSAANAPLPAPPPLPAAPSSGKQAQGQWDFSATAPHELSFKAGDILTITDMNGPWWKAELNGQQGLIPGNYVKLL